MNLEHFRHLLLEERQQYADQVAMINETGLGMSQQEQLSEDSMYDNHPADLGTETFERSKDLSLRDNALRQLDAIDRALERIDQGTYGICEECGSPIPEARLEAFPSATTCIRCQEAREAVPDRFDRPIEEQVLYPPFGRTFRDGSGDPGYDGEDAWQEVAQYGTSESPSDVPGAVRYTDLYNSDEEVYTVVEPVEALVDENGEPLLQEDWDRVHDAEWDADLTDTLYGPADMAGEYHWEPAPLNRTVMPERQFRRGRFPRRRMP